MENREYKVAFVEDMLFDLAINRTLALYPAKHIDEECREWFTVAIREADVKVRELLDFILVYDDSEECYEPLCFTFKMLHRLHRVSLPPRIENALIALVCDRWFSDNGIKGDTLSVKAITELKSAAYKCCDKPYRKYEI